MNTSKNKSAYKITIEFNEEENRTLYSGDVIYDMNSNLFDHATISANRVVLECVRNSNGHIERVLTDLNSTMNKQITKCIAYLVATRGKIGNITKIEIEKRRGSSVETKTYNGSEINNPINVEGRINLIIPSSDLQPLFTSKKSEVLMIALSFWLRAMSETEAGAKFEAFWRSYNALYGYIANKPNENERLRVMRGFILANPSSFPQSLSKVSVLTKEQLRKLQWRNMILNNHDIESKTEQFADFILRNHDERLIQIFQETLVYREEYLKRNYRRSVNPRTTTLYQEVTAHITNCLAAKGIRDDEVLSFLINKYIYFVRNKLFHGEKVHPTFKVIKDYESEEIQELNDILSVFIYELIRANHLY
jgi:hypothetical protein